MATETLLNSPENVNVETDVLRALRLVLWRQTCELVYFTRTIHLYQSIVAMTAITTIATTTFVCHDPHVTLLKYTTGANR